MTLPAYLLGFMISSLFGAAFHLWRGGGPGRLLLYLILAWAGFWAGHLVGDLLSFTFGSVGPLRLATATLGALLFLAAGYWLSLVDTRP